MTADLAVVADERPELFAWRVRGRARIDERPAVPCTLVVRTDGTWAARIDTFTLAGEVDLFLVGDGGGHFCGPAMVSCSRADSYPAAMWTELVGTGPLLVVAPRPDAPALGATEMVDGEVVE